jgi:hypothetical protein
MFFPLHHLRKNKLIETYEEQKEEEEMVREENSNI